MSRRGWLLFSAMSVIWGIPYLLIKIAVAELAPATLVLVRVAIGTVVLLPITVRRRELIPVLRHWRPLITYTVVELCIPWYFLAVAEQTLSSSLTGLLIATVPLVSAVLVLITGRERLGARRLVGLVVGFAGVAALVGVDLHGSLLAVGAVAIVAVCYALGPVIQARYLSHLPDLGVVAASLVVTMLVYLPFGVAQAPTRMPSAAALAAMVTLGVVCTAVAFVLFFRLIAEAGPARATVITYVNPAVALVLGVVVLNESFTLTTAVGFGLILLGSVWGTSRERRAETVAAEP